MAYLGKYVQFLWELSVALQVAVVVMLLFNGNFRRIPIFTAYIMSNVCQAVALYLTYREFGLRSHTSVTIAWVSESATLLLRVFATSELVRLILRPYRGIWALGWRVLAIAFGAVFTFALVDSWHNLLWAIVLLDRGFHLAFAVALTACLLLVHYYLIPIHPVYRSLLAGFCFYSCMVVLANTIGGQIYARGNHNVQIVWQMATMGAFVVVLAVWAAALRRPLPEPISPDRPEEAERAYWAMSPQINERLRLLNEQLSRFWKPEATRS